ncbi:MAG: SagB/ThcOx family dehydrogenase [Deltaproteobacteria bacterium]|nr:SagB/ThcOx family dehydrogenase [Deltaproteobacteria bacterium]MBW2053235.1 SagB/ThcOx family dehydrogenase [Deltaproteobacteria bacterium]MBW2141857.1 SagB/ThcOx family dehydrogenase [Deltaproteobacteria bacterium]MBW2324590.1 SagB/ThcOx family dehydrogenase [Deltaproteobacteria bacterium]
MSNLNSATAYHHQTEYSRDSGFGPGLDWSNQPRTAKVFPNAETVPLPHELTLPRIEAARVLLGRLHRNPEPLNLHVLAGLLYMAHGFTSQIDYGTEVLYYRSAPSAGALYPTEIYLVAHGVDELEDGLYYYSPDDFALVTLRKGAPPPDVPGPALILSSVFFRSAWKYRDRSFRYCLLDMGHVIENLTLISPAMGLETSFEPDFDDDVLNDYLGFDPARERALSLIRLDSRAEISSAPLYDATAVPSIVPQAEPVAPREETFDLITSVGHLTSAPLTRNGLITLKWSAGTRIDLPSMPWDDFMEPTLVEVLQKRRSRRNFKPRDLPREDFSRVLDLLTTSDVGSLINLGVTANSILDIADGFYHYRPDSHDLDLHKGGFLTPAVSTAALNQDWISRANLVLILTAPLKELEESLGRRALRLVYLAAGRLGQRAYLAAEIMDWGCCGIGAFFDTEVQQALTLPPGEEVLYLISLGPIKKRTHGGRPHRA